MGTETAAAPPPNPYAAPGMADTKPVDTKPKNVYATIDHDTKKIYEPGEVLGAAGDTIVKGVTEDLPNLAQKVVTDPVAAAKAVGSGGVNMVKSMLSLAGLPLTALPYAVRTLVSAKEAEEYKKEFMDPGLAVIDDYQSKYGGLFGGPGKWGWEPKQWAQNIGRTIVEHPVSAAADVLPGLAPAFKTGKATLDAIGRIGESVAPAVDAAATVQRLTDMGINHEHLTAAQIDRLRTRGNELNWDKAKMEQEYHHTLFDEAGVAPSESMATGSAEKQRLEDNMRNGTQGMPAADIIAAADKARREALVERGEKVRSDLTGNQTAMTPKAVGETITERYNVANQQAKNDVKAAYAKAFDPAELAARNIPLSVDDATLKGVYNAALNKQMSTGFSTIADLAPNSARALKELKEWSVTGKLPEGLPAEIMPPPGTSGASWQSADVMRKYLNNLREAARTNNTDLYGMRQILDAFDEHLGNTNSLLKDARAAHADRVKTFEPGRWQASNLNTALKVIQNGEESGLAQFNRLFGTGAFKSGEAITAIDRFKKIYANDPAGMAALKEGALQNLFMGKTYDPLSPKVSGNAIKAALNGPQADIYKTLFTPDELAQLSRHQEVLGRVGDFTQPINPPRTAQVGKALDRSKDFETKGKNRVGAYLDTAGSLVGAILGGITGNVSGLPMATHGGAAAGAPLGGMTTHYGPGRLGVEWLGPKEGRRLEGLANDAEARQAQSLVNPERPEPQRFLPRGPMSPWKTGRDPRLPAPNAGALTPPPFLTGPAVSGHLQPGEPGNEIVMPPITVRARGGALRRASR